MSILRARRSEFLLVAAAFVLGCDDATGTEGSIQIALSPAQVSLVQGGTGEFTVQLTRGGNFAGPVTLSASGLPFGMSVSMSPSQLTGTTLTSTVTVSAAGVVPPGTASATITATADGVTQATAALQIEVTAAPDFRLTSSTTVLTLNAGGSVNGSINLARTNFTGVVTLSLLNAPEGITAVFNPAAPTSSTVAMTINVAPTVTPASYPLIIQGVATGLGARTVLINLSVQPPVGAFTINLSPSSFTLPRGNGAVVNITLDRLDYTGPIALAFENPPPGITGTITPGSTTGNTATFTINVGDNVSAGIYSLRIRGTAPTLVDRVAFVQITVTVPVGSDVDYLFCDPANVPVFFAYQDGSGAWKEVTRSVNGSITSFPFTLAQGRGGVMVVFHASSPMVSDALRTRSVRARTAALTRAGRGRTAARPRNASPALLVDQYHTEVVYGSALELRQAGVDNCRESLATKTVTGSVAGVPSGEVGILSLGGATAVFTGGVSSNPVTFTGVPDGTLDLVGTRFSASGNAPDRVLVIRGLEVSDGDPIPVPLDFAGPSSSAAATATATITGASFDLLELFTELVTANGQGLLWFDLVASQGNQRPWGGLGSAVMQPGDMHGLIALATPFTGGVSTDVRVSLKYVGAVSDQTLPLGPPMNAATATQVTTGGYPRYRFQGTIPTEYGKGVSIAITPNSGGNTFSIIASNAWLAATGNGQAFDLTMPDIASLTNFPAASRLAPGPNEVLVTGFGFTGLGTFDLRPGVGESFRSAVRTLGIGVP